MAEKKKLTAEELHEIRSRANAMRKHRAGGRSGGRPSGSCNQENIDDPMHTIAVRTSSYQVFRRFAFKRNLTIAAAMKLIATTLKENDPEL